MKYHSLQILARNAQLILIQIFNFLVQFVTWEDQRRFLGDDLKTFHPSEAVLDNPNSFRQT